MSSNNKKEKLSLFDIVGLIIFAAYIKLVFAGLYIVDPSLIFRGLLACTVAFLVPLTIAQLIMYFTKRYRYKRGLPLDLDDDDDDDKMELDYFDEKDLEG